MSSFDYIRSRQTAERLIARFGKDGAVRRVVFTDDPDTPWNPGDDTETAVNHPCKLVVLEYSEMERDGTVIGMTDKRVLISTEGLSIVPTADDALIVDGIEHEISKLMVIKPGETIVYYDAQVVF